jgi:hypothetical protein
VEAGLLAFRDRAAAAAAFDDAAARLAALAMPLHAAAASRRCGELAGGDAGRARAAAADREIAEAGVVAVEHFCRLVVPALPPGA